MTLQRSIWNTRLIVGIITVILGAALSVFFVYAIQNRPIIKYYMDAPDSLNLDYQSKMRVILKYQNTGNTEASIILKLIVINTTISNETIGPPHKIISDSEVEFYYSARKNMDYYARIDTWVKPNKDVDKFTIQYIVKKRRGFSSYSEIITSLFGECKNLYPTYLTYKKSENIFSIEPSS